MVLADQLLARVPADLAEHVVGPCNPASDVGRRKYHGLIERILVQCQLLRCVDDLFLAFDPDGLAHKKRQERQHDRHQHSGFQSTLGGDASDLNLLENGVRTKFGNVDSYAQRPN